MTLKTLGTALDVLSKFTEQNSEWGLRELAKEMDMNHTVLYRILKTYESKGFLVQDHVTKRYELGSKMLDLLSAARHKVHLSDFAVPIMNSLSNETNESVFLTWRDGFAGTTVEISESPQQIKFAVSIGYKTPLYAGASCKVIMAFLPLEEQMKILQNGTKKFTDRTLVDKEEILSSLQEIKQQGWCYSEGEFSEDVFGIGVPIFGRDKKILGSLTVAGPIYRINPDKKSYFLDRLSKRKTEIEHYIQLLDVDEYQ
ncbi:IclR family transcriptional regulator [Lentibacillus daqui]|uniref:IclR family transcriptional regulator n=1 Tax=Lentibacillus daqui TaxID=2911514 RepID=UPI0022B1E1A2|nr:IclR family transcriptional regulator [Lentibacillus daqui]